MNDLNIVINLLANSKGMEKSYQSAATRQVALNREMNKGQKAAVNMSKGLNVAEREASQFSRTIQRVGATAATMFGIFAAQNAAISIKNQLSEYQDFRTRLQFLSGDTQTYQTNLAFLDKLSQEHGKSMLSLGDAYTQLAALQRGNIITLQESQDLTVGLSNASSALGASNEKLSLVYYGLGQALSQPKVQAQELNQVVEPLPGLLQELTKAAGLQGKSFRNLVIEGEVTNQMFKDTLLKALASYDGAAKANINNIKAQENALSNMRLAAVKAFEEPIENVYSELLSSTSSALKFAAENADTLTTGLEVLITAGLLRGTAALGGFVYATGNKINANIDSVASDKAAALAAVNAAKAENTKAQAIQAAAQRQLSAASTDGLRARAITNLARANQAAIGTQNAVTLATANYTKVAGAATIAARGLYTAIGGLPGLLVLGGFALYQFASAQDEATESSDKLKDSIEGVSKALNPFAELTRTQATSALGRLTGQLELAAQVAQETRDKFNNPYFDTTIEEVIIAENKVKQYTTSLAALQKVINDFARIDTQKQTDASATAAAENLLKQGKEADKLLASLERQVDLYGKTTQEAKIRYELESGKLTAINDKIAEKLIAEARAYDLLVAQTAQQKKDAAAKKEIQDAYDTAIGSLERQQALFGATTNEARLRYDLESGKLSIINEQLRDKLILEAKQLDAMEKQRVFQNKFEQLSGSLQTPEQRERNTNKDNLSVLNEALDNTPETELTKRTEINQLILAEQQRHQAAMSDIQRQGKDEFDALWNESFDRFASGIGQATSEALFESQNLGEGIRSVVLGVGKQMVATLVEIGVKRLVLSAINQTTSVAEASTAAGAAVGSATTITAAMTPAAAATTLATAGTNGVGSLAAISAVGAAIAAMFAGFFDKGGFIPGGQFGIAGEFGPEIVKGPAHVTSRADTAKLFNRGQVGGSQGSQSVVNNFYNSNQITMEGAGSEEDAQRLQTVLEQNNRNFEARVSKEIGRRDGPIYHSMKRAMS